MQLLLPGCLLLVIMVCSIVVMIEFATRPLRSPFTAELVDFKYHFPVSRLLDRNDFDFLRRAGFSRAETKAFRANRRRIARLWLRTVAADFNSLDQALSLLLVSSRVDRPDLASVLARQRVAFCWRFLLAEFQLALDACGFCSPWPLACLNTLENLCARMREFAVTVQPMSSAA
jgi:hypothetical protein